MSHSATGEDTVCTDKSFRRRNGENLSLLRKLSSNCVSLENWNVDILQEPRAARVHFPKKSTLNRSSSARREQ